jgi:hypothetical protein
LPCRLGITVPLDRDSESLAELPGGAEQAGVGEVHDGPQFGELVLDRRPGQCDAGRRGQRADRPGLRGVVVLDRLCLIKSTEFRNM